MEIARLLTSTPAFDDIQRRKEGVLLTAQQSGALVGLGRHPLERLKRASYLDPSTLAAVEQLAARPTLSGGIPVLRLGDPDVDRGRRIGHHKSDSDHVLEMASLGWWGGPVEAVTDLGYLSVAVSGFIIGILRIDGIDDDQIADGYRRVWFDGALAARASDLVTPEPVVYDQEFEGLARALLGNRVPNPQGAPIVIV